MNSSQGTTSRPAIFSDASVEPQRCDESRENCADAFSASVASLRFIARVPRAAVPAFTLLELLVVIAIIGLLAALTAPVLRNFRPNYTASATAQLMDAIARGRQLAISERTTVYMVFVPTNYWGLPGYPGLQSERNKGLKLLDKQLIGYNFVSLRSMGDQPGRPTVHYLDSWRTLPDGAFIAFPKFQLSGASAFSMYTNDPVTGQSNFAFQVYGFDTAMFIPFPSEDTPQNSPNIPYARLPYIAFDYMGRLARFDIRGTPLPPRDVILPLSKGSVNFSRDSAKLPLQMSPSLSEQPPGNATNSVTYNVVAIDWITGRARALHQEVR